MDRLNSSVHPTAIVWPGAEIGSGVEVGPYAVIGQGVCIGDGTRVGPHSVIEGNTRIGRRNRITGQCSIGLPPQDLKYGGEDTAVRIGDDNIIREFVTIHRGTAGGRGVTEIGSGNLLMTGVHIAHDCVIGSRVIMGNAATLAGHVDIADDASVGAFVGLHQFCRVGLYAFIGGYSVLTRDALPFAKTVGYRNEAKTYGINTIGLERKGFAPERIEALKRAYRWLFHKGLRVSEAISKIRQEHWETPDVAVLTHFMEGSQRGFVR